MARRMRGTLRRPAPAGNDGLPSRGRTRMDGRGFRGGGTGCGSGSRGRNRERRARARAWRPRTSPPRRARPRRGGHRRGACRTGAFAGLILTSANAVRGPDPEDRARFRDGPGLRGREPHGRPGAGGRLRGRPDAAGMRGPRPAGRRPRCRQGPPCSTPPGPSARPSPPPPWTRPDSRLTVQDVYAARLRAPARRRRRSPRRRRPRRGPALFAAQRGRRHTISPSAAGLGGAFRR